MSQPPDDMQHIPDNGLVQYTQSIYALHALSVAIGVLTTASVVGRFLFGLPSLFAVVMNYARGDQARNTYLESHFAWQIRTFWFSLLWVVVISLVAAPLLLAFGLGIVVWIVGLAILGLWVIYRVLRGWLTLRDGRAIQVA
jgi:uncharacterized membrane protein